MYYTLPLIIVSTFIGIYCFHRFMVYRFGLKVKKWRNTLAMKFLDDELSLENIYYKIDVLTKKGVPHVQYRKCVVIFYYLTKNTASIVFVHPRDGAVKKNTCQTVSIDKLFPEWAVNKNAL